jgi:MFS family permease
VSRRPPLPPSADDDSRSGRLTSLVRFGSGNFPVPILPVGLLRTRRRVAERAQARDGFASIALTVVLTAMFMVNLSVTAIAVAVPKIAGEFDAAQATIVWAVTGPILVSAVLGPTFGKLGDQRGHRLVFLFGLTVNAFFTILIAVSWNAGSFVVFRLLAAVGGAAIGPSALAFINRLFAPSERTVALGWWSFVGAGSPVIGVVAGGLIIDKIDWRWVFIGQAPLVFFAMLLAGFILPETTRQRAAAFDLPGAATLGVGVGALLVAVTQAAGGPFRPQVIGFAVVGAIAVALFIRIESRSPHPLIPPHYWKLRGFIVPTLTLAMLFAAYMGSFVLAPLMLQSVAFATTGAVAGGVMVERLTSAALTSRVIIARPLMFSLMGPVTGRLVDHVGERVLVVGGGTSIVASMLLLSGAGPGTSLIVVAVALGLAGLGMGAASPILTATVANSVRDEDLGVAGAAQQMLQQVGLVVGVQILQSVQAAIEGGALDTIDLDSLPGRLDDAAFDDVVNSYQTAFLVATAIAAVGVLVSMALPRQAQSSDVMADSR